MNRPLEVSNKTIKQLQVQIEKRVESGVNVNKEVNVAAVPAETQGSYAGGNSQANFGFSGGYDHQAGSKLINDIFNVNLSRLNIAKKVSPIFLFCFTDSNCYFASSKSFSE